MIESILSFLETPRIAYLTTIDKHGYPHTVPVWFAVDGDDIISSGEVSRARTAHIRANPRGSITIGGNEGAQEGYLIQGSFSIETDASHVLRDRILNRYVQGEALAQFRAQLDARAAERIIFRLAPTRVIKVA